jgi:hypothetical protein
VIETSEDVDAVSVGHLKASTATSGKNMPVFRTLRLDGREKEWLFSSGNKNEVGGLRLVGGMCKPMQQGQFDVVDNRPEQKNAPLSLMVVELGEGLIGIETIHILQEFYLPEFNFSIKFVIDSLVDDSTITL